MPQGILKIRKKIWYGILLILVAVCLSAASYRVLAASRVARVYDEKCRITQGLADYRLIFQSPLVRPAFKLLRVLTLDLGQSHPVLFEVAEALSWKTLNIAGFWSVDAMIVLVNGVYLLILLFAIYGIGSRMYGPAVGMLSAFLTSMLPIVFGHTRVAMLDYPLMCMVTLTVYLLLKTEGFSSLTYSILAGLVFGLSELTKETAVVFILPVLVYYFVVSCASGKRKIKVRNLILFLLGFTVVFGAVYFRPINFYAFSCYLGRTGVEVHPDRLFYLKLFPRYTGPLMLVLFLPLLFSYLRNFKKREKLTFFWLVIPFLFFSVFPNKTIRFLLPVMPAFILIVVQEIYAGTLFRKFKKACIFLILCVSLLQYALINYGLLPLGPGDGYPFSGGILTVQNDRYLPVSAKLLEIFKNETVGSSPPRVYTVNFLFNVGAIHCPFQIESALADLPLSIRCFMEGEQGDVEKFSRVNFLQEVVNSDYIIDKSGHKPAGPVSRKVGAALEAAFAECRDQFRRIAEIEAFDGSYIYVYKAKR